MCQNKNILVLMSICRERCTANPSELLVQRFFVICVVIAFGPAHALGATGAGSFSSPWVIAGVMIGSRQTGEL